MKRILASLVTIALLGALAAGATFAVFTDQEVLGSNTVATGTLALTLNHSAGKPYSISNAYPGYVGSWEHIDIFNAGTLPFEGYLSFNKTGGDTGLYNELTMKIETAGGDGLCNTNDFAENLIYNGKVSAFTPQTLVSSLNYWHLANEDDASGSPADNIRSNWTERLCQQVGVDVSAGNSIMGKSVTFSEVVDAMQDND
ncbi:MAG TPA: TasA family protein [Candidatus Dojkabacteria bacterium]|nr:TasA family protein [Candidatus Dojkabacteria bacterium]